MTLRTTHILKNALFEKLPKEEAAIVAVAQRNLPRLRAKVHGEASHRYLDAWERALANTDELRTLVLDESDEGLSAWQLAPFAGVFSPEERYQLLSRR